MSDEAVLNVQQSIWNYMWHDHPRKYFLLIVLPIFLSLAIGYTEYYVLRGDAIYIDDLRAAIFLFLLPLLVPIISYIVVMVRMRELFYTQLATALNCSYSKSGTVPTKGYLFAMHDGWLTNILQGTHAEFPIWIGDFTYSSGSDRNRTYHFYTAGGITTRSALPSVICVPVSWNNLLSLSWKPEGYEELPLEGNFNTKFIVYVPKGQDIEGLQILEPTVMEKLMDGYEGFGFELVGPNIYLFTKGTMREDRTAVLTMYALLGQFADILSPELQSFTDHQ